MTGFILKQCTILANHLLYICDAEYLLSRFYNNRLRLLHRIMTSPSIETQYSEQSGSISSARKYILICYSLDIINPYPRPPTVCLYLSVSILKYIHF